MKIKLTLTFVLFAAFAAFSADTPQPAAARPSGLLRNRAMGLQRPRLGQPPARRSSAAETAAPAGGAVGEGEGAEQSSDLQIQQAPIDMVLEIYSRKVGKTVLKDPQVPQATITLKSEAGQKLSEAEQIEAIEIVLEMNGVHLEPYGEKFIRALPRKDARKEGIPLIMDPDTKLKESGKVVSMMIPFKNISTEEAQKALEGFKSNSGILLVFERTNSILATDTEQNINRMLEIARAIDVASPVTEVVEYIQIKYASATEVKQVLDSIVQESQKELEKNGKAPANQVAQPNGGSSFNRPMAGGLLRRPGQPNNQPAAPVNNQSLVMTVSDADRGMIRGKVVTIADERSNKILLITNAANMKFFKDVIAALDVETTPDTVVKVYRLKYAEAEDVSDMINDLIGNSSSSKNSGKANQNQNAAKGTSGSVTRNTQTQAKKPANQRSGEAKAGELNKDNTTVLADKRINGIVVMTDKELVPTLEQIIESMDVKLSQVLIETVIIEVSLDDGLETGMDWVQKGRQKAMVTKFNDRGEEMRYLQRTTTTDSTDPDDTVGTTTEILKTLVPASYKTTTTSKSGNITRTVEDVASEIVGTMPAVDRTGLMNNWFGATRLGLGGGASAGSDAFGVASGVASNMLSKAFSFVFDSDELGLSAILHAQKDDSRSKYIASPIVMTLDNKEATINATRMKYLLKGFTSSGNSMSTIAVPDYEQKELGIEIKVTPKINPNGTVMLTVEEKYTQVGADQTIQYAASNGTSGGGGLQPVSVPTTITREMSADVLLENNQTVVFGGLTETQTSESESGIPILKDIPWIGKWLFGRVTETESRTELLVFMTPYVLDDAQAAQVEALRRKKTMSDSRPWEDHGWSLSPLADPVSKKEQMRRIKEEWAKQDEERKTKIAIEKMKVDRAKTLEKMSEQERKLWLEMHKKELDEEHQDELEEKMLDPKSQEELKKLVADFKAKKLGDTEKKLKAAADEAASENERGRLDAEKKAKVEAEKAAQAKAAELAQTQQAAADKKAENSTQAAAQVADGAVKKLEEGAKLPPPPPEKKAK